MSKRDDHPLTTSIINCCGQRHKALKHELIRRLGPAASVFLMELVYQCETARDKNRVRYPDGDYFHITSGGKIVSVVDYFHSQFGYTYRQQNKSMKILKKHGLLDYRRGGNNGVLVFSVNVDAIKTMIEAEKQSAGSTLNDPRFDRSLKNQPTTSLPNRQDRSLPNRQDRLNESVKTLISGDPCRPTMDSSFPKEPKGGAPLAGARSAPLSSQPDAGMLTTPANAIEFEQKLQKWKQQIEAVDSSANPSKVDYDAMTDEHLSALAENGDDTAHQLYCQRLQAKL